jgi:hypothetical protein
MGAGDICRISVYVACFRLKLSDDFAKKAIRFIKNILSG